jgi:hypothetical protein
MLVPRPVLSAIVMLGLLVAPLAAEAQPAGKVARVGLLSAAQPRSASFIQAFEHRLRDLGYVEGQDLIVEFRTGEGKAERYSALPLSWSSGTSMCSSPPAPRPCCGRPGTRPRRSPS